MLFYYDEMDVSERTGVNKTSESKRCDVYHYRFFLDKRFKLQSYVCNRCHDLVMISIKLSDIAILNILKSALIQKRNLIESLSTIKKIRK